MARSGPGETHKTNTNVFVRRVVRVAALIADNRLLFMGFHCSRALCLFRNIEDVSLTRKLLFFNIFVDFDNVVFVGYGINFIVVCCTLMILLSSSNLIYWITTLITSLVLTDVWGQKLIVTVMVCILYFIHKSKLSNMCVTCSTGLNLNLLQAPLFHKVISSLALTIYLA